MSFQQSSTFYVLAPNINTLRNITSLTLNFCTCYCILQNVIFINCVTDVNCYTKLQFLKAPYSRVVLKVPLNSNKSGNQSVLFCNRCSTDFSTDDDDVYLPPINAYKSHLKNFLFQQSFCRCTIQAVLITMATIEFAIFHVLCRICSASHRKLNIPLFRRSTYGTCGLSRSPIRRFGTHFLIRCVIRPSSLNALGGT